MRTRRVIPSPYTTPPIAVILSIFHDLQKRLLRFSITLLDIGHSRRRRVFGSSLLLKRSHALPIVLLRNAPFTIEGAVPLLQVLKLLLPPLNFLIPSHISVQADEPTPHLALLIAHGLFMLALEQRLEVGCSIGLAGAGGRDREAGAPETA